MLDDVSSLFKDVLTYPFRGLLKSFIFLLMLIGSFLVIPYIIAFGYLYRIIECSINGQKGLPDFVNGRKLLFDGFKLIGAYLVIVLPVLMLFLVLGMFGVNGTIIMGVSLIISFLVAYFYPFLIGNMIHETHFTAIFQLKKAINSLKKVGYKKYTLYLFFWIVLSLIPIGILIAISTLSTFNLNVSIILSLISIPVLLLLEVYLTLVGGRFIGLIIQKSLKNK